MSYNRVKLLKEYSILYPTLNLGKYSVLYPTLNSRLFNKRIRSIKHCIFSNHSPSEITGIITDVIDYSKKKNIRNIVLSCEGLLRNSKNAKILSQTIEDNGDMGCIIIAYLRRQDHWFESAWKQWGVRNNEFTDINEYIVKTPLAALNWFENLNTWAEVFGKENVIVTPYEKGQLNDGLINDFLKKININFHYKEWVHPPMGRENIGFNSDIIEIFKLNRGFYTSVHDNRLSDFFSEGLGDDFKKKPFEKYLLLSPDQRLKILEKYEPMNRRVAQHYLKRTDGRLFYEPWPDPNEPFMPYEGLTVEKIVPIITKLLYNMDTKYKRQYRK